MQILSPIKKIAKKKINKNKKSPQQLHVCNQLQAAKTFLTLLLLSIVHIFVINSMDFVKRKNYSQNVCLFVCHKCLYFWIEKNSVVGGIVLLTCVLQYPFFFNVGCPKSAGFCKSNATSSFSKICIVLKGLLLHIIRKLDQFQTLLFKKQNFSLINQLVSFLLH